MKRLPLMLLPILLIATALYFHQSKPQSPEAQFRAKIDAALAHAATFLLSQQAPDGSFPSQTYGALKDDLILTPHVLYTLQNLPQTAGIQQARKKAAQKLATSFSEDRLLAYPVYTLATSIAALVSENQDPAVIDRLTRRLISFQFSEEQGWSPGDATYGGWGYNLSPVRKPATGTNPSEPLDTNLSATTYALRALYAANFSPDDPVIQKALRFVHNCQNFPPTPEQMTPSDDGGFYFSPVDATRNKAGAFQIANDIHTRFRSYGAMSADGVRALAYCGRADNYGTAASNWLLNHFTVDAQPGEFPEDRQLFRLGMYYYYLASAAQAATITPTAARADWARRMAPELLARQNPDGSWTNRYTDSREDDPLVATSHAALALALCRKQLTSLP